VTGKNRNGRYLTFYPWGRFTKPRVRRSRPEKTREALSFTPARRVLNFNVRRGSHVFPAPKGEIGAEGSIFRSVGLGGGESLYEGVREWGPPTRKRRQRAFKGEKKS